MLITALLSAFLLALITLPAYRWLGSRATWLLSIATALLFSWFLIQEPAVANGQVLEMSYPWIPRLNVAFALRLDGLSLLFALLVTGIGAVILLYGGYYMSGYSDLPRFQAYMLLFMSSMLGVVLADDLITLFVFWELTSVSSYLLIGFRHEDERARYGALKALLITGGGGLAMLAGVVLLGIAGNSFRIGDLLTQGDLLTAHPLYTAFVILILLGAFTKSAQVPFHIWLPDAMAAPTPASAYLHSATMVKAGIYLLARLHPAIGGTELWQLSVGIVGLVTMLVAAYLAFGQNDLKALLAYTTISSLGWVVALIGMGSSLALKAAVVAIVAHSVYKAALFLLVGIIEHETGTRDLRYLGGLWRMLPVTAVVAGLVTMSMAGLPPLFGFLAKETLFEAALHGTPDVLPSLLVAGAAFVMAIFAVGYSLLFYYNVFLGKKTPDIEDAHEPAWPMLLAPGILAALSLLMALPPLRTAITPLLAAAASQSYGAATTVSLYFWHGFTTALLMTIGAVTSGLLLFAVRNPFRRLQTGRISHLRLDVLYDGSITLLNRVATGLTVHFQTGTLSHYLLMILSALIALVGYALVTGGGAITVPASLEGVPAYEVLVAILMILAVIAVATTPTRLGAIAALGIVGFFMTLFFVIYSGPDLALTQLMMETLTVVLLLLVFYFLPEFFEGRSSRLARWRDIGIATGVGALVTVLTLMVLPQGGMSTAAQAYGLTISEFYLQQSLPTAFGANVVNVILVDFRAIDTLGEITVLVIALLGAYGLIKLRLSDGHDAEDES
jgi:multicomponent Na+:H+ antiporter subunit A